MTDAEIRELLLLAHQHDAAAREARAGAGRLLGHAQANLPEPEFLALIGALGLDARSAELLIGLGAGGRVRNA